VHALQTLAVQISLVWQSPHASLPPQPSSIVPQFLPAEAQVSGVQDTHTLLLQTLPASQLPQSWVTPTAQWSVNFPHSTPAMMHAGCLVVVVGQVQFKVPPQRSEAVPQVPAG